MSGAGTSRGISHYDPYTGRYSVNGSEGKRNAIIGKSGPMIGLFYVVDGLANGNCPVRIHGETGTGKESVARALHYNGKRAQFPFVIENCGGVPPQLLEDRLFGHVKGAFTGAVNSYSGSIVNANGGTLFLDEIGDMPLELQGKLLRVLEEREVVPLGSTTPVPVDFRLVTATHRDLEELTRERRFRKDLFYRISGWNLDVPSLSEREDDVLQLTDYFLSRYAPDKDIALSNKLIQELKHHSWPGNIRQLESAVHRAVTAHYGFFNSQNDILLVSDFEPNFGAHTTLDTKQTPRLHYLKVGVVSYSELQQIDGVLTGNALRQVLSAHGQPISQNGNAPELYVVTERTLPYLVSPQAANRSATVGRLDVLLTERDAVIQALRTSLNT
ncbi:hypothetical protein COV18_05810 [Candidatus Woesearchaeota archaeon CG10_big_fil_rev_8_21_14_0_10_37_12]|nr:MAG: hypothetical protein COV18_05810 [Candidatus Woesearchaeota archaeon CG10_big_fil_rev_8_21_14_0_10_37_12]